MARVADAAQRQPISLGAALTVAWAMTFGDEAFSVVKVVLLAGIVGAVIGLKVVGQSSTDEPTPEASRR